MFPGKPTYPGWWPQWQSRPAAIVASGESASLAPLAELQAAGVPIVVINQSWELLPTADILYACDFQWWRHNNGAPGFRGGLKLSQDERAVKEFDDVRRVWLERVHQFLFDQPGRIGSGGNGGFQALNLVLQFGCQPIGLFGYDMGGRHWHGGHPRDLNDPDRDGGKIFANWIRHYRGSLPAQLAAGRRIINFAPASRLDMLPKADPVDAARILTGGQHG